MSYQPNLEFLCQVQHHATAPTTVPMASGPAPRAEAPLGVTRSRHEAAAGSNNKGNSNVKKGDSTETIKPGVTALPTLPEPSSEGPVDFQDWVYSINPALEDISDNSAVWWNELLDTANQSYAAFLKLDPESRLTYVPAATVNLSLPKWHRVGKRVATSSLKRAVSVVRNATLVMT